MMPVSTPQNAVVYGSKDDPVSRWSAFGSSFDIIGIILIVLLIPVMARLVGFV